MNMKRILYILAVAFSCMALSVSCQTKEEPGTDISGVWHLVDTEGLILDQEQVLTLHQEMYSPADIPTVQDSEESAARAIQSLLTAVHFSLPQSFQERSANMNSWRKFLLKLPTVPFRRSSPRMLRLRYFSHCRTGLLKQL